MVNLLVDHRGGFCRVLPVALCEHHDIPSFVHLLLLLWGGLGKAELAAHPLPPLVIDGFQQGYVGGDACVEGEVGYAGYPDVCPCSIAVV